MVATLLEGNRRLGGDEFTARAERAAGGLDRMGVGPGDVVALLLRNEIAFFEAMMACRLVGAHHCPVNWHFKAEETAHILRDSGAKVLVAHADLLAPARGAVPAGVQVIAVEPSAALRAAYHLDLAECRVPAGVPEWESWLASSPAYAGPPRSPLGLIAYSSGTTGRPKGIRRRPPSPENLAGAAEMARVALGIGPGMRTATPAPLYHSAPNTHGLNAALAGELVVVLPRFDAEGLLAAIERHRLTHLYLVPTMFVRLLKLPEAAKRRHDVSSLRYVVTAGAPCPPDIRRQMIDWWGPVVHETYGSSETGLVTFCTAEEWLERPGTVGRFMPLARGRILDEEGRELPPGEIGTLYCYYTALSDFTYSNNDAARRAIERDGLIGVGDMGYIDEAGYLFLCDRKVDMVISGGVNIYPAEIEAVLITMPGVLDCAVFGIPHEEFGEALAAHVQAQPGARIEAEEVRAFLRERLADYKVPRLVELARELPRDDNGKIYKRKLREPYWRDAGRRI